MFKYTIDTFTLDQYQKPIDIIQVVVTAMDEPEAVAKVFKIAPRADHRVVRIEELSKEFQKA